MTEKLYGAFAGGYCRYLTPGVPIRICECPNSPEEAYWGMIENALKPVGLAALLLITTGVFPNRRYGAMIAVGICITAAVVLHFAAP